MYIISKTDILWLKYLAQCAFFLNIYEHNMNCPDKKCVYNILFLLLDFNNHTSFFSYFPFFVPFAFPCPKRRNLINTRL